MFPGETLPPTERRAPAGQAPWAPRVSPSPPSGPASCLLLGEQAGDPARRWLSLPRTNQEFPADQRSGQAWPAGRRLQGRGCPQGCSLARDGEGGIPENPRGQSLKQRTASRCCPGAWPPRASHQRGPTSQNQGWGPCRESAGPGSGPGCVPSKLCDPGSALPAPPRFVWFIVRGRQWDPAREAVQEAGSWTALARGW